MKIMSKLNVGIFLAINMTLIMVFIFSGHTTSNDVPASCIVKIIDIQISIFYLENKKLPATLDWSNFLAAIDFKSSCTFSANVKDDVVYIQANYRVIYQQVGDKFELILIHGSNEEVVKYIYTATKKRLSKDRIYNID